jgi:hypothetical protein
MLHWAAALAVGIDLNALVGQPLSDAPVRPVAIESYLQRLDRVRSGLKARSTAAIGWNPWPW